MMHSKIALHQFGGRWGNHSQYHRGLQDDFAVTLYEADADARIDDIREATKDEPSDYRRSGPASLAETDCE